VFYAFLTEFVSFPAFQMDVSVIRLALALPTTLNSDPVVDHDSCKAKGLTIASPLIIIKP
jgi:hypothetical protein